LKLFERVYAPLTAGLLSPFKADAQLEPQRRSQLDRLYQRVLDDLDTLVRAVGLKAPSNENKIHVTGSITVKATTVPLTGACSKHMPPRLAEIFAHLIQQPTG
jgi:hypothetical protein